MSQALTGAGSTYYSHFLSFIGHLRLIAELNLADWMQLVTRNQPPIGFGKTFISDADILLPKLDGLNCIDSGECVQSKRTAN